MKNLSKEALKNTCFSLASEIKVDDKRQELWAKQREERGFDDTELWNLDTTILKFVLPRLKVFKEQSIGYPSFMTEEEWNECLDKMISSIEEYLNDEIKDNYEGIELFKKHLFHLWW